MSVAPQVHIDSPWLVPFDASFAVSRALTETSDAPDKKACRKQLDRLIDEMGELQRRLYAADRHSVLLVFQAMDAAGKDSTIRAALSGVDPAGFQVYSFKQPSAEELDHDFLWRSATAPAAARTHRRIQSQLLRGSAGGAGASRVPAGPETAGDDRS